MNNNNVVTQDASPQKVAVVAFLEVPTDWKKFGVLGRRSLMGGGRLREVEVLPEVLIIRP